MAISFANKAITRITKTILTLIQGFYLSVSSLAKQVVDPQTKSVDVPISVDSSPSSQGVFKLTKPAGNNYSPEPYHMSSSPPSDDDRLDHRIRIINPSPSSSSSSSSGLLLLPLSLPENLRLVQHLNNTTFFMNPADGETNNAFLLLLNHNVNETNDHHQNPNPKLCVLQKSELGKTIFGVVAPITMGLLALIWNYPSSNSPLPRLMVLFVVSTLSFGSAFIWNGILLRDMLPRSARGLEELGISLVFLAFFALVSAILPLDLIWASCLCYLLTVLPILVLRFHDAGGTSCTTL